MPQIFGNTPVFRITTDEGTFDLMPHYGHALTRHSFWMPKEQADSVDYPEIKKAINEKRWKVIPFRKCGRERTDFVLCYPRT